MRDSYFTALEVGGWKVDTHPDGGYVATRGAQGAWGDRPAMLFDRVMELERVAARDVRTRPHA